MSLSSKDCPNRTEHLLPTDGLVIEENLVKFTPHRGRQDGSEANYFGYPSPEAEELHGV